MTYHLSTLENGLRVASEFLPGVESVAIAVSVGVGARYEGDAEGGISHLLEHMAFKGTERRSARQIAEEFDHIGGQFNAYTSLEHTVYYAKVLKEHLSVAVDILTDILQHSVFDKEELAREQGVVLQEIAMNQDSPEDLISDLFDATAFPNQPIGRTILGTPSQISAYTRDNLCAYMRAHYTPKRMVISAAGNVKHEQLLALVQGCLRMPVNDNPVKPEAASYKGGDLRQKRDLEQLHLLMGFPSFSVHHPDYYALQLYNNILGGGMSSRLFQEIREKRGLVYHVSSMSSAYSDCGTLSIYAATGAEQSKELPMLLVDELKKMHEISEAELIRVKNQQKAELLMARENPGTVAGWIGKHLLVYGRYIELPEITAKVDAITREDIARVAEHVISHKQPTLAALGPVKNLPAYEKITTAL